MTISLIVLYSSFHLFYQNISSEPIIQVFFFPFEEKNQFLRLPSKTAVDEYIIIPRFLNSGKPEKKSVVIAQFWKFFSEKVRLSRRRLKLTSRHSISWQNWHGLSPSKRVLLSLLSSLLTSFNSKGKYKWCNDIMPDDSRDEFLPENEREGCKKLSHYLRTYVSSRQQSLTVAWVIISCWVSIAASRIKQ